MSLNDSTEADPLFDLFDEFGAAIDDLDDKIAVLEASNHELEQIALGLLSELDPWDEHGEAVSRLAAMLTLVIVDNQEGRAVSRHNRERTQGDV